MKYYEKAGRYNDCFRKAKYLSHKGEENILRALEEEIPELERQGDLEGLALRYALLERKDDLNRVVKKLEMTEWNVTIFEESDQYMKAIENYLETGDIMSARLFFGRKKRIDELAPLLEQRGYFVDAAGIYEISGDRESAIRCYQQLEDHEKVGDMYFKSREYPKALEAYQKEPWIDPKKIARTYERLADWENALKIYQEVGNAKGYERCKKKMDRIEAKRAIPRLPFEQP
jgi:tetratricopeptide (TPR) repeat protein